MTAASPTTACGVPSAMMRPCASTKTCSASRITACITCSIISIVMPRPASARMTGTMAATSRGLSPASTSSSRRSSGPAASARASSSRLRPATVRLAAARPRRSPSPTALATSAAASSASARARRDRCAPIAMFSCTLSPANGCATWNVRTMPRRARRCAGMPVISAPRWKIRPSLGVRNPLMMENKVVLPAPLGPMSAVIRPVSTANEALSTASRPSKRLHTRSRRSNGSAMGALRRARPRPRKTQAQVGDEPRDPLRRERYDQDHHAAVDDEVEAGRVAGDELGQFPERLDQQRTEQRAERGADPTDDGSEQSLDGNPRSISDPGVDEEEILRVESSAGGGDGGGNRHGRELDPLRVDTDRFGGLLVFAHGDEPGAESALLDQPHNEERGGKQRKDDPVERRATLELERLRPQVEGDQD